MLFRYSTSFRVGRVIALALLATVLGTLSTSIRAEPSQTGYPNLVFDFDEGVEPWRPIADGPDCVTASALDLGRPSLVARFKLAASNTAGVCLKKPVNLLKYTLLRFRTWTPETGARLHFAVYAIDLDDKWYQTSERIRVRPACWDTVEVDLAPGGGVFEPVGHARPWGGYVAQDVQEVGIQIFTDRPVSGDFCLDDIEFVAAPEGNTPQVVYNFETNGATIERYGRFEITFELSRTYRNPFDPDEIAVWGRFTSPSGAVTNVPGFFFQDYERHYDQKVEYLTPVGPPKWKIRFCPREEGRYAYSMEIVDKDVLTTPRAYFTAVLSENPGCVRVSPQDKRYFDFEDGSFFYPIGHNIPATYNTKAAEALGIQEDRFGGTHTYDRFLDGMKRGRENFARIWLAAWSFGIEWTRKYNRAYRDLGQYNMENAWRFDYALDKATRYDIYVQLALTTFGHWRSQQFEGDWRYSPYRKANGGPLDAAWQFWSSEPALETYDRMLRYVMARWGYSTHIASWEICNEIDLVDHYKQAHPKILDWHRRCVRTIRKFDQNPHLVTTNFSNVEIDSAMLSFPEISYSSTNNYNPKIVPRMRDYIWPKKAAFEKPAIMAECGYDFHGAFPSTTVRYLHLCLWGSYMIPFAGAGMSWWWDFIDDRDLYEMHAPLAKFAEGEDRRGRNLEPKFGTLQTTGGGKADGLEFTALRNDRGGYFWIYETRLFRAESDLDFTPLERKGIVMPISDLSDGTYRIEFWDTVKGEPIAESVLESKGGDLLCPVPAFTSDIAGKIRAATETAPVRER